MTDSVDRDHRALEHIEDLLAAYADARLTPSRPLLARMRAQVLREVAARSAIAGAEPRLNDSEVARGSRWSLRSLLRPRRAVVLGMAATLTLGTGAAVLAAPPGSPLYDARVAFEAAFLPGQVDARLTAHEDHLSRRLMEAAAAAARGDLAGLAAALAAYQAEIKAAVADVGDDAARLAHLEAELARHTAALQALAAQLPEQAAIEHAIDSSQRAMTKLREQGAPSGGKPSTGPDAGKPSAPAGRDSQQGR